MIAIINEKLELEIYEVIHTNPTDICAYSNPNIKGFVSEMLEINFLQAVCDGAKEEDRIISWNDFFDGKFAKSKNLEIIQQFIISPVYQFNRLDNFISLISDSEILTEKSSTQAEKDFNRIVKRKAVYSSEKRDLENAYSKRFRQTVDMIVYDIYSDLKKINHPFAAEIKNIFKNHDIYNGLKNIKFDEYIEYENNYEISCKTKKHIEYLEIIFGTQFPFEKHLKKEMDDQLHDKDELTPFTPIDFCHQNIKNKFEVYKYINECRNKYFAFDVYYFDSFSPESLLYFCMLYLKINRLAKFSKCKICGKIAIDSEYCHSCNVKRKPADNEQKKLDGMIRKARFDMEKILDKDTVTDSINKKAISSFYNNLLFEIGEKAKEYILHQLKLSVLYEKYSLIEETEKYLYFAELDNLDDFNAKSKIAEKLAGCDCIETSPNKKYNELIKIYKTYLTPSRFYKSINCSSKMDFDKIINIMYDYIDLKSITNFNEIYRYYLELKNYIEN